MSEPTGGSQFFEWTENFSSIPQAAEREGGKTLTVMSSLVSGMVEIAARAEGINFNPLAGAFNAVNRDVNAIQNELLKLKASYEEMARLGVRPPEPFDVAAQRTARAGAATALSTFDQNSSGVPGAEQARRALLQGVTEGSAQLGRELQSQLRGSIKGVVDDVAAYAGTTANRLRANLIAPPAAAAGPAAAAAGGSVGAGEQQLRAALGRRTDAEEEAAAQVRRNAEANRRAAKATDDATTQVTVGNAQQDRLRAGRQALADAVGRLNAGDPSILRPGSGRFIVNQPIPGAEGPSLVQKISGAGTDQVLGAAGVAEAQAVLARVTREAAAAEQRVETEANKLANAQQQARPSGLGQNFAAGLLSSGFGGGGAIDRQGIFDGLARSAGTTLKYTALYSVLGQLQGSLSSVTKQFLDANDSVTELQVAMGQAADIGGDFVSTLGDVAAVGGFNVGEAMDTAASGIRAFGSQADGATESNERLGASFAKQASRIAVLSKTTLTDAAGNLKAISAGFDLPKSDIGFAQVADAIAGAKLAGGGDEKQIGQGLANSALIFKEMGFSLNEAATIISRINTETDESGTLIANRVSRLNSIIGGSTGKNFINQLNQTLTPDQRVDTQGSIKDQILQLGEIYRNASTAVKAQIVTALGGTAQGRETIILLQQAAGLVKATDEGFEGKALREFQERLQNVRAQLNQIKGNVEQIVVNLTQSGLAAPALLLVEVLRGATSILREVTQLLNSIPTGFLAAAASAAALLGILKLIRSVREAGGVGGFLREQEARFLPQNALARRDLAAGEPQRATRGGSDGPGAQYFGARRPSLDGAADAIDRGVARIGDALNGIRAGAAGGLRAGAGSLGQALVTGPRDAFRESVAAGRTFPSPVPLLAAITARTRDIVERAGQGALGAIGTVRALPVGAIAQVGVDRASAGIVTGLEAAGRRLVAPVRAIDAALLRLSAAIAAEVALVDEYGVRRYVRDSGGQGLLDAGNNAKDTARRIALSALGPGSIPDRIVTPVFETASNARGAFGQALGQTGSVGVATAAAAREAFAPAGRAITTGITQAYIRTGEIARGSLASVQTLGRNLVQLFRTIGDGFRNAPGAIGGQFTGLLGTKENPGALRKAGSSLKGFASAAGDAVGGPIGIAIAGATIAAELKGAADAIHDARTNLEDLRRAPDPNKGEAPRTFTADELQARAESFKQSAANADEARSGIFGSAANVLTGGEGDRVVNESRVENALAQSNANFLKNLNDELSKNRLVNPSAADQIDQTDSGTVSQSLQQMAGAGANATQQMDALQAALLGVATAGAAGVTALNPSERGKVAVAGAEAADKFFSDNQFDKPTYINPATGKREIADTPEKLAVRARERGAAGTTPGLNLTPETRNRLNDIGVKTIQKDLDSGIDLSKQGGVDQLTKDLEAAWKGLLPPEQAHAAAVAAANAAAANAKDQASQANQLGKIDADLSAAPAAAASKAAELANNERLRAFRTGTVDKSKQVGANTQLNELLKARESALRGYQGQGLDAEAIAKKLAATDAAITAARIAKYEADSEAIKTEIDESNKARDAALAAATSAEQKRKVALGFLKKDIKKVLASGDAQLIQSVMGQASKTELDAIRAQLVNTLAAEEALAAAEAAAQAVLGALAGVPSVPSGQGRDEGAPTPPKVPVNPAQAAVDKTKKQIGAFDAARSHITTTASYYGDTSGTSTATPAQIAAANAAAAAERNRDSIAAARAALAGARADYAAAKPGSLEQANALKAVYAAQNALNDALRGAAAAARKVGSFKDSAVDQARIALADAAANLHVYAKKSAEYYNALGTYKQAQRDLATALADAYFLHVQANSDLTDPVAQANIELRKARAKLARDRKAGAPQDVIDKDRIDVQNAANQAEAAKFNQRLSDAQTADQLGRISHKAYLQYLQNEHDRLSAIKGKTRQQRDELDQIDQAIKAANDSLQGQFNLGDIKVPTVYEVRRAIANQTGATSIAAIQNSTVNNNQQITVNGADFAKVVDYLKQALGQQGSARLTVAPRKG